MLKEKINQLFILGYEGGDCLLNPDFTGLLKSGLGGVIFFTQNILNEEQFKSQIKIIKSISKIPPFLSIDEEGGRVERFENINKKYPDCKKYISAKYIAQKGKKALISQTQEICKDLKNYGLNMNFAPVLDVNSNPDNPVIGERAYSDNPEDVSEYALLVNKIYNENGIITAGKHFPGHGDTNEDSHLKMPTVNIPFEEFEKIHIYPFKKAIEKEIPSLMISHVHYKCFDGDNKIPATMSKKVLSYLINRLKYKGLIISDDMEMGAVKTFNPADTVVMMLKNGVNCFIYRTCTKKIIDILNDLEKRAHRDEELNFAINNSYNKILNLKESFMI